MQFFKQSNVNSLSFNIFIGISPFIDLFVFKSLITFLPHPKLLSEMQIYYLLVPLILVP